MNRQLVDIALTKIAHGDSDAFEKLYMETKRGVYAFLFSFFDNYADCEDAMQIVYLKIKTNISQYTSGTNGLAWILQIAKNTALNELRKKTNIEKSIDEFDAICQDNLHENLTLKNTIMSIMKRELNKEEQRIVILHVVIGYKHKEIAKMLIVPLEL